MSFRPILENRLAAPTIEGAGVHLHRAFGFHNPKELDPFLLFDDFRGDDPIHYQRGFPWHPHRGIETITYVLAGDVTHEDSLGNKGTLGAGDVQWMTAGSGIMHQEMPKGNVKGEMHGFQLWANLPRAHKMTSPRYQDIQGKELPALEDDDGSKIKVIIGDYRGYESPIDGIAAEPQYLDVFLPPNTEKTLPVDLYRNVFAYIFEGSCQFAEASAPIGVKVEKEYQGQELEFRDMTGNRTLVRFGTGDEIRVRAGDHGVRFLLVSGRPIEEPVAWHGPIVMNTADELREAIRDLQTGNFIRENAGGARF